MMVSKVEEVVDDFLYDHHRQQKNDVEAILRSIIDQLCLHMFSYLIWSC